VSFLSGDVHCCGVGRFYTRPKVALLKHDYRFMTQVGRGVGAALKGIPLVAGCLGAGQALREWSGVP
jgi:hypothetical protein